jgi:hypothetical protein
MCGYSENWTQNSREKGQGQDEGIVQSKPGGEGVWSFGLEASWSYMGIGSIFWAEPGTCMHGVGVFDGI